MDKELLACRGGGRGRAHRRRTELIERGKAEQDGGWHESRGDLIEVDGVPDHIREREVGACWAGEQAPPEAN